MDVTVNGTLTNMGAGALVASVVAGLGIGPTGSAVALNGEVVPRSDWARVELAPGDVVEVLTAVQGG